MCSRGAAACASAAIALVIGVIVAVGCSSSSSPESRCEQFLSLTQDCYAKAGVPIQVNSAACGDPNAVTPEVQAQIDCALQYSTAYCETIEAAAAALDGGGVTIDPHDPGIIGLNACLAEGSTQPPCKDAIATLAQCGAAIGFAPDCTGSGLAIAQCVLDNPTSACAALGGTGSDAGPQAGQAFVACEEQALTADAGGGD
jgi:hypothetical protein